MEIETGRKLIKERNFKDAEKYFLNLLNKGNKDINVFFFLGLIYSELSNIKKSVFYYNKCLKQSPNSINVLLNLAYVYQSFGKIDYAKKIYIKIIFLNKSTIRAYYGLFTLNPNFLNNEHYSNIFEVIKNDKLSFYEKGLANFLLSKIEKEKKKL